MKIQILNKEGRKIKELITTLFKEPIRKDIILKVAETEKIKSPYSPKYLAGMKRSASGNVSHRRHAWKSDRGKGLSRIPRKIFWRRGTQFSWEGAIIPSTRGGRRAHPPKISVKLKKINKKEYKKALFSSLTYVNSIDELKKKYSSITDFSKINLPIVIDQEVLSLKTKEFLKFLKKILQNLYNISIKKKTIRAGIGKLRGRKYKRNAGLLLIIGKNEEMKIKGIDIINTDKLMVSDLASNGARLTIFSEEAIKDLEKIK